MGTIGESGFRLFKTHPREGAKILRNVGGCEEVLDGPKLVGVRDGELKSIGLEFDAFAEAVIGGSAQDHERSAARGKHAVGFMDGSFHLLGAAVVEDTEAKNSVEAVVGERQTEHGSLRQQKRGAGVAEALAGVGKADERNVNATRRKAKLGGHLGVASSADSNVQEARGRGLAN